MEASELNIQGGALSSRLCFSRVIFIPQHTWACRLRDLTFSVISAWKYLIRGFLLWDVLLMACLCCWRSQGSAWRLLHCWSCGWWQAPDVGWHPSLCNIIHTTCPYQHLCFPLHSLHSVPALPFHISLHSTQLQLVCWPGTAVAEEQGLKLDKPAVLIRMKHFKTHKEITYVPLKIALCSYLQGISKAFFFCPLFLLESRKGKKAITDPKLLG